MWSDIVSNYVMSFILQGADKLNMGYENMADGKDFDVIMEIWKIIEHETNIV